MSFKNNNSPVICSSVVPVGRPAFVRTRDRAAAAHALQEVGYFLSSSDFGSPDGIGGECAVQGARLAIGDTRTLAGKSAPSRSRSRDAAAIGLPTRRRRKCLAGPTHIQ